MAHAIRTRGRQAMLANQIHATLLNQIAAVIAQSQVCERAVSSGDNRSVVEVGRLKDMLKALDEAAREIVETTFDTVGPTLAHALQAELETFQRRHPEIRVGSALDGAGSIRAQGLTRMIVDIVHEALVNAARHGNPSQLELVASRAAGGVLVRVRDNGRGFDMPAARGRLSPMGHYGIHIMTETAQSVQGRLEISSAPGRGTQVTLFVPVPGPRAERQRSEA